MVYAVSAFGNLFVTVFMRLGCSSAVTSLFVNLPLGKWGLFALMMGVVFLLGFLMDWIAVCMITIPIFVPIATQVGFQAGILPHDDGRHNAATAFLSPPMAASIFYFQGVAKRSYNHGGDNTRRLAVHGNTGGRLCPVRNIPADSDMAA